MAAGPGAREAGIGRYCWVFPTRPAAVRRTGRDRFQRTGARTADRVARTLRTRIEPLRRRGTRCRPDTVWVTPSVVGEVRYRERTDAGRLRHPTWRGLRDDKSPDDVRIE
ncbi:hypothetical protein GS425_01670 [Rhodococcus hoagii]|nr:hypothetical protein [Prescottella equi]